MKKLLLVLACFSLVLLSGCEKVGAYKEGTYFSSVLYESYGKKYVVTAVLYINDAGMIKSCFIDSTYNKDDVSTTKKVLGDAYGMKAASSENGVISGGAEWNEQIKVIEDKVVSEQGIDWVKWKDEEQTELDSVSGVTITADVYIEAVEKALAGAK